MRTKRIRLLWAAAGAAVAVVAVVATAIAVSGDDFKGKLKGYKEVPAVSTHAKGSFKASLRHNGDLVDYTLKYGALEGNVTQAHIHFGQKFVSAGISVWLCGNPSATVTPPAGTQPCPPAPATVTGTFSASNVVGPAAQGIAPGELAELVRAMRKGLAYANVHSTKFPGGEIRAQLRLNGHGK